MENQLSIGFTATRQGITIAQVDSVVRTLKGLPEGVSYVMHHGDCIGGDEQCHSIVRSVLPSAWIIGHPCNLHEYRAYCACDEYREEKPPLDRNKDIVEEITVLIGCPSGAVEQLRGSGTWATIRYARKLEKQRFIIYPDGRIGTE